MGCKHLEDAASSPKVARAEELTQAVPEHPVPSFSRPGFLPFFMEKNSTPLPLPPGRGFPAARHTERWSSRAIFSGFTWLFQTLFLNKPGEL